MVEPQSGPARQRDVSSSLGSLLLQGYAMLAESCPKCMVPLMRERGGQRVQCVECGSRWASVDVVETQADGGAAGERAEAARPAAEPAEPASPPSSDESPGLAAALGDRAMPRPVQLPGSGRLVLDFPLEAAPVTTPRAPSPTPPATGSGRAPRVPVFGRPAEGRGRDPADLLSEHMLQGWALLQSSCPLCGTLLVRSRDRSEVRCVVCDVPVRIEGEREREGTAGAAGPPAAAGEATTGGAGASGGGGRVVGGTTDTSTPPPHVRGAAGPAPAARAPRRAVFQGGGGDSRPASTAAPPRRPASPAALPQRPAPPAALPPPVPAASAPVPTPAASAPAPTPAASAPAPTPDPRSYAAQHAATLDAASAWAAQALAAATERLAAGEHEGPGAATHLETIRAAAEAIRSLDMARGPSRPR